jgi:hypothetical protein
MGGNYEVMAVYDLCKNQVMLSPMGGVIGVRLEAIKTAMDLLGVENQVECVLKVNLLISEMLKKDE